MKFWNLIPDDSVPEDGVLDIEGPIGTEDWYEDGSMTGSRLFKKALQGVRNVTVHINSPGGDVMAGAEIYSALREHSMNGLGKVTVIVTALAASAASVIAMAGDEILISPVAAEDGPDAGGDRRGDHYRVPAADREKPGSAEKDAGKLDLDERPDRRG